MSPYLTLEVRLVGMSTVLGFILMASYDFLRLFRFFVPHGRLWTGIEDFFYWIYAAVMTFLLLFYENSGIVRAYIIACVFFGMIFYDKIISRNVFQLLKKLKNGIRLKDRIVLLVRTGGKIQKEARNHGRKPEQTK